MAARFPTHGHEPFISPAEAGRLIGVSKRTVHAWADRGVLKSWKTLGGHRRISLGSVNRILEQRQADLGPSEGPGPTLLLVDDDADLRILFQQTVSAWPFPVRFHCAKDGFDGLIQAGLHRPDLIVSDLDMPGMDGFQMVRSLLETPDLRGASLVVMTALSPEAIAEGGGLPEEVTVFHKPAPFERIQALLRGISSVHP